MYGAILGDMIGSPYEFDRGDKTKDFPLFNAESAFTDDSVMTVAVAEALLHVPADADEATLTAALTDSLKRWGNRYPNAGYGARFIHWLAMDHPEPYNSCGNGSAMRVSPAAWLYDSMERTREVARATAVISHNHPEGIKAAEATAAAIYMARNHAGKEEIKEYIVREFGYDLSRTLDEIRPAYHHIELAQKTVPEAITAFLEAEDFEDSIRNAVSLGGDTDTLAAITGSIAEAFFGIPVRLIMECVERLPEDLQQVVHDFYARTTKSGETEEEEDLYAGNARLFEAIEAHIASQNMDDAVNAVAILMELAQTDAMAPAPMVVKSGNLDKMLGGNVVIGESFCIDEEVRMVLDVVMDQEGRRFMPLFTDQRQASLQPTTNLHVSMPIRTILLSAVQDPDCLGVVINPFSQGLTLQRGLLEQLVKE